MPTTLWDDASPGVTRGEDIAVTGGSLTAAGTYMTIGVKVDLDGKTLSGSVGSDNSFSTPQSMTSVVSGTVYPAFSAFNGDSGQANFGATQFERPIPSGYTAWDASCVWDSANKDASITLSGSNLIATGTASSSWRSVRGTTGHTSGKWYYEVKCLVQPSSSGAGFMVGVENASGLLNNYMGAAGGNGAGLQSNRAFNINGGGSPNILSKVIVPYSNTWRTVRSSTSHTSGRWYVEILCNAVSGPATGWMAGITNASGPIRNYNGFDNNSAGFYCNRSFYKNGSPTTNVLSTTITATHILGLDIDLDNNTIAGRIDNGTWSATQSITSINSGGVFVSFSCNDGPSTFDSATVNFGGSAFTYTPPAGSHEWDYVATGPSYFQIGGEFVSVLDTHPAALAIGGMYLETLSAHPAVLEVNGVSVELLRSSASSPIYIGGLNAEVMRSGPTTLRSGALLTEVVRSGPDRIQVGGMAVEVMYKTIHVNRIQPVVIVINAPG